jgi:hypothetical protein
MSTDLRDRAQASTEAAIELWRFEQLAGAGFPADAAMALAARRDIDLHAAVELALAGCPSRTALDILL